MLLKEETIPWGGNNSLRNLVSAYNLSQETLYPGSQQAVFFNKIVYKKHKNITKYMEWQDKRSRGASINSSGKTVWSETFFDNLAEINHKCVFMSTEESSYQENIQLSWPLSAVL